jgi:hypothetical protein
VSDARAPKLPAESPFESARERPVSPLLGLMPHFLDTLRREPALAISLTYLLVAMAGIFYDVSFYRKFGIPVLSLEQLGDFLTAGIQQPVALVLVASTFPICWVFDRINVRSRHRQERELEQLRTVAAPTRREQLKLRMLRWRTGQMWYTRLGYLAVIVAYGWLFVGYYADYRAAAVKKGDAPEVRIWLNGATDVLASSGSRPWIYLGAISSYVFVYDRTAGKASILPVNAVERLEPVPGPEPKPGLMVAPIP